MMASGLAGDVQGATSSSASADFTVSTGLKAINPNKGSKASKRIIVFVSFGFYKSIHKNKSKKRGFLLCYILALCH